MINKKTLHTVNSLEVRNKYLHRNISAKYTDRYLLEYLTMLYRETTLNSSKVIITFYRRTYL